MIVVGDLESDGLLPDVNKIWCASFEDVERDKVYNFPPKHIYMLPEFLEEADIIVMHNLMGYDRLVIEKIMGYTIPLHKCEDTLVLSKLLNPDRKVPKGWTGIPAPHSIEAWGMRFGIPKPEHEDWSVYTPEMMYRCEQDRIINVKVYNHLMGEMTK